jgi:hypothetical protein
LLRARWTPKVMAMDRCRLLILVSLVAGIQTCWGGNILIQNFLEDGSAVMPVLHADGTLPAPGSGIAVAGGFLDESAVFDAQATIGGWRTLLAGFVPFGSTVARLGDRHAYGVQGLYAVDASRQLRGDDVLIGKTMFTLIGNEATLEDSTSVIVLRHAEWFVADRPVFGAMLFPFEEGVDALLGSFGGGVVLPILGAVPHTLRFERLVGEGPGVTVPLIPESRTALLLLLGVGWSLKRRRPAESV